MDLVQKSLISYIREEERKVFIAYKTEEFLNFDFSLQKGEAMFMSFFFDLQYYVRIDSVKSIVLQDQKERIARYVSIFQ